MRARGYPAAGQEMTSFSPATAVTIDMGRTYAGPVCMYGADHQRYCQQTVVLVHLLIEDEEHFLTDPVNIMHG